MSVLNQKISYDVKENIAYIGFGKQSDKSMTVLDEVTLKELDGVVAELESTQADLKGAIFFSHIENCFLAGADINLIASMKTESDATNGASLGQNLYNRLEDLKIPTVACIDGVCLGGGLEFALSMKSIIASDNKKTSLGLPEVKLGLIPGFGGTYRLPKRVGLPSALDLILTGKTCDSRKALKMGLVDEVFPKENLLKKAPEFLQKREKKHGLKDSLNHMADNYLAKKVIFSKAREGVLKQTKGFYEAPLKILDVMEAHHSKDRDSYLASEAQAFGELCLGVQSQNLLHLFFMMEEAKKYTGPVATKNIPKLKRGAALGAGTMGGGIAWLMASGDMAPLMKDLSYEAIELGLKQAASNFRGELKRKKITPDDFERKIRSIGPRLDYQGFKKVDLVIEAIVENMEVKKNVFQEVEKEVRPDCILTSNTSSLSVEEMASVLEYPERFAGLHFFNPVHRMPLVEIITHKKVAPETLEALYKWCLRVKKTPIIVGDGPGFLVNRILMPFLNEAGHLLEEGVSIKDLDHACVNFGMPMGPCRLLDEVGLDVAVKVAKILNDGLGTRVRPATMSNKMVEAGFLGKKNSKGFYLYDGEDKEAGINPAISELLPKEQKKMTETEIQLRVFLPMINEASTVLNDGIVNKASQVDLGLIFGIGFPPFRGGLLKYADSEGLDKIVGELQKLQESVDKDRYRPSEFLQNLVKDKKKFYDV